jgi:hypothetical protein
MLKKIKYLLHSLKTDRKFTALFVLYIVIVVLTSFVFIHWEKQVSTVLLIFSLIGFIFISLFTWSLAALAVFRSLMVIGAGLSLILFIAQSYCGLDIADRVADDSLRSLIGISVLFIGVIFVTRLYRELFGDPNAKREFDKLGALKVFRDANKGKDSMLFLVLYASFMGLILGQLFQVLFPIFNNLCVYGG